MKITKSDLENYRYDMQQAKIKNDESELDRLKNILSYIRQTARGKTRMVIIERYINGDGKSEYGGFETWTETAKRIGLSEGYCKSLDSEFFKKQICKK